MQVTIRPSHHHLKRIVVVALCIAIAASLYLVALALTPAIYLETRLTQNPQQVAASLPPVSSTDTIYIPRIGVVIPFKVGDASVLNDNAWHRYPERGTPKKEAISS